MLPYVRGCGRPASRMGCPGRRPSASVQTAIHGDGHDRLDVRLVHAFDDDRDVEPVLEQDVEGELQRIAVELIGELRQRPAGPFGAACRERDAQAAPAGIRGHVLPAGDPAIDLGPDEIADVWIGERGHAIVDTQRLERRRQDRGEGRRRRGVRVLVRADVEALRARELEPGDRVIGPTPHRARSALEVRHLETGARTRRPDGRDRLVERLEQAVALVAHVGRVHAATARRRGHERLDLVGSARASPGRRSGPSRDPARPRPARPSTAPTIAASSSGVAAPSVGTEDGPANGAVADEERDVRPERLLGDPIEVLPEGRPARRELVRPERQVDELAPGVGDRREGVAAVARELGGKALVEVAGQGAVEEERSVRVAVRVDETGRHDPSGPGPGRARRRPDRPATDRRRRGSGRRGCRHRRARPAPPLPSITVPPWSSTSKAVMHGWCHVRPLLNSASRGAIAQLEEHLHGMQGVRGSSPRSSTNRDETPKPHPSPARRGVIRLRGPDVTEPPKPATRPRLERGSSATIRRRSSRAGRRAGRSSGSTRRISSTSPGPSPTS